MALLTETERQKWKAQGFHGVTEKCESCGIPITTLAVRPKTGETFCSMKCWRGEEFLSVSRNGKKRSQDNKEEEAMAKAKTKTKNGSTNLLAGRYNPAKTMGILFKALDDGASHPFKKLKALCPAKVDCAGRLRALSNDGQGKNSEYTPKHGWWIERKGDKVRKVAGAAPKSVSKAKAKVKTKTKAKAKTATKKKLKKKKKETFLTEGGE